MAILHKNISAEGDIHNPKWFSGANNGDVAWRNELGVLESTDELVLPAALNFVDGSAAPPTSNSGDIYVLSSGASVNAGWGTVALGDWVRYDGTTWNDITPQKSTLCYNETLDSLISYTGSAWVAIGGGDNIGNADLTIGTNRVATLTNSLRFRDLTTSADVVKINGNGEFELRAGGTTYGKMFTNGKWALGGSTIIGVQAGITLHRNTLIKSESNSSSNVAMQVTDTSNAGFFRIYGDKRLLFGNTSFVGSEDISLQGSTAIKGIGTSGSSALAIYDNDTTPVKVFEVLDDSTIKTNGNAGFTGTGAYTNFTIENGIITNAT